MLRLNEFSALDGSSYAHAGREERPMMMSVAKSINAERGSRVAFTTIAPTHVRTTLRELT